MIIKSKDINQTKFTSEHFIKMKSLYPSIDDETIARFLIARNNDVEKASEQINKMIAWKSENYPILKSDCLKEIKTGKMYVRGIDKEGRPLLIFRSRFSFPKHRDLDEARNMIVWWAEHIIKSFPDDRSKFTVLFDRSEHKHENTDMELIKYTAQLFQDVFPERLHACIICPSDVLFYTIWGLVKWFLDPVTREKVHPMLFQHGIEKYVDKKYIPISMGGTDDYEYNPDDYPDPYSEEVIQQALLARSVSKNNNEDSST